MTADRLREALGFRTRRLFRLLELRNPYSKISNDVWKDRTVFEIAPDVGLNPNYFLKFGARKIVAYAERKSQVNDTRVEWNGKFYLYDLLLKYPEEVIKGSILVMDCDGYEYVIRPSNLVGLFPSWVVAIHTANLEYDQWFNTLSKKGSLISNRRRVKLFTNLPLRR